MPHSYCNLWGVYSHKDPLSQFPDLCDVDIYPMLQRAHEINMQEITDERKASYVIILMWSRLSRVRPHYIPQSIKYLILHYKVGLTGTNGRCYACPSSKLKNE